MQNSNFSILVAAIILCSTEAKILSKPILEAQKAESNGLELRLHKYKRALMPNKQKIEGLILQNPSKLLQDCNDKMDNTLASGTIDSTVLQDEQENPVWLLNECMANTCIFTRTNRPGYRKILEDSVIKHTDKTKPLVYTSFGSGYLFQDLVMMTKLIKSGHKDITNVFVEKEYAEYIEAVKDSKTVSADIFDSNPLKGYWLRATSYRFMQFLQWIGQYKDVKHKLIIYPNMTLYAQDCKKNPALKSDLLLAVDWLDDNSDNIETITDLFVQGVDQTLKIDGIFASTNKYGQEPISVFRRKEADVMIANNQESLDDFLMRRLDVLELEKPTKLGWMRSVLQKFGL